MRGHYGARGQIDTGPVREALAGSARALHSIVGWAIAFRVFWGKVVKTLRYASVINSNGFRMQRTEGSLCLLQNLSRRKYKFVLPSEEHHDNLKTC